MGLGDHIYEMSWKNLLSYKDMYYLNVNYTSQNLVLYMKMHLRSKPLNVLEIHLLFNNRAFNQ